MIHRFQALLSSFAIKFNWVRPYGVDKRDIADVCGRAAEHCRALHAGGHTISIPHAVPGGAVLAHASCVFTHTHTHTHSIPDIPPLGTTGASSGVGVVQLGPCLKALDEHMMYRF